MQGNDFLGLPIKTWIIVGGLFLISTLSPSIIVLVLNTRKESNNE